MGVPHRYIIYATHSRPPKTAVPSPHPQSLATIMRAPLHRTRHGRGSAPSMHTFTFAGVPHAH
ncbi:hypothetical protein HYPSUDRAFT_40664 [Hypholoma sublateritium FD-334 SS-4]|uniref:Uncharacterized protein n=1 Tax=Hypholoma sublateritium (strain FD-334 SS-4) TaxID=945553 RepID=A0A0D2PS07_HYPSF|nr:hypothetical protein HYPSUDRAFT_40664 [Hypholoma sublateritium FD-334 SS-4]